MNMGMDMDMMTMTMYFYSSPNVIFLNKEWHVKTGGYYTLILFITFAIGFCIEMLAFMNYKLEFSAKKEMKQLIIDEGSVDKAKSRSVSFRVLQLAISICRLFASYILMLIAMTFNAGLLIAIILGLTTSYFIFGLSIPEEENQRVSILNNT